MTGVPGSLEAAPLWAAAGAALAVSVALVYAPAVRPHAATSNTVLFDREIVRILNEHCVMCHTEEATAFPLETYEQTWVQRVAIHDQVLARHMPPWAAVPGYGEFVNENRLTLREKRFIVSWVEGLGPRNDGEVFFNVLDPGAGEREPVRARPGLDAWQLGEPDLAMAVAPPHDVEDGEPLGRALTVLEPGLERAREIRALEYRPNDHRGLHAVVFSIESTGQWLATWTPWHGLRRLPDGAAYELAPGQTIVADARFDAAAGPPAGGELGLHFAEPGAAVVEEVVLDPAAEGPSSDGMRRLRAETELAEPLDLLALWPELPPGADSIEVAARHPDGRVEMLLLALDLVAEWPTSYVFDSPRPLPSGTVLTVTAYMNDRGSPALESPRLRVSARRRP